MRLTKSNKIDLVKAVIKAKLKDEHKELTKEAEALGKRCIDELFGGMERRLRAKLDTEEIASVGGTGIAIGIKGLHTPEVSCELGGDRCEFFSGSTNYPPRWRVDYITTVATRHISNYGVDVDAGEHPELFEALMAQSEKRKAFIAKAKGMIDTLWNGVSSFTTRNKLLEAMPALEPYLPAKPAPAQLLPIESINEVNAMLRGAA